MERTEKINRQKFEPLFEELNKFEELNVKIDAFKTGDWGDDVYVFPSDRLRRLVARLFLKNGQTFEIARWLKQYDIVHIRHSFLFSKILPLVERSPRPKLVMSLRGGDTYVKPWISETWRNYYDVDKRHNLIDRYLVRSENQADYLTQKWKVNPDKVIVSGVGTPVPVAASAKFFPTNGRIVIVSVMRLTWEKNILQSLLFIKKLKNLGLDFEYHVVGEGPELGQLMYLINRLELNETVVYHGYQKAGEIAKFLEKSHFILQLSISEALSASLLEAQAKGLVPIVFDSGGIPEAVSVANTSSALMAELGDLDSLLKQFMEIVENPEIYHTKSKAALNVVRSKFALSYEAESLRSVYHDLYSSK